MRTDRDIVRDVRTRWQRDGDRTVTREEAAALVRFWSEQYAHEYVVTCVYGVELELGHAVADIIEATP